MVFQQSYSPVQWIDSETTYGRRGGGPTTGRNRRAARRSEEQVEVGHALWAEPYVTFKGKWHTIEDAGINPRPARSTCSASCAP